MERFSQGEVKDYCFSKFYKFFQIIVFPALEAKDLVFTHNKRASAFSSSFCRYFVRSKAPDKLRFGLMVALD